MGYDTLMFGGGDDSRLVAIALAQDRVILTRDTQIMQRRVVTSGRLKAILIRSEQPELQASQVIGALGLDYQFCPFSRCLECNQPLEERRKEEIKDLVPPYVFRTQEQYRQCPGCHRIYWRGTHWEAMTNKLSSLGKG